MNLETYARAQIAGFCIGEAWHYGGVSYMLCIACILRNRVMAGMGSWLEVVRDAPGLRGSAPPAQLAEPSNSNVRIFLQKVEEIYSNPEAEDLVNGGKFYIDTTQPRLKWFEENILGRPNEHRKVGQATPLYFFE